MSRHDDWVETGARELLGTDKPCKRWGVQCVTHSTQHAPAYFGNQSMLDCGVARYARIQVGQVIDTVEPLIRADERERIVAELDGPARESEEMYAHAEAVAARLVEVICEDAAAEHSLREALRVAHLSVRKRLNERAIAESSRDAARAEVDRLTIEIGKVVDSRERTRVEAEQKVIDAHREAALARAEVAALTRWKAEATAVIEAWERVHTLLGSPGRLGESKAAATYDRVAALRSRLTEAEDCISALRKARVRDRDDLRAKVEGLRDESIWARRGTVAENGLDTVPSAWHNGRTSLADAVLALIDGGGSDG